MCFGTTLFIIGCASAHGIFSQTYDFCRNELPPIPGNAFAEKKILELVNEERKMAGLNLLEYDSALQSAARQHSQEMLKLGYFSHTSPTSDLKNPSDRVYRAGVSDFIVGENIALHSLDAGPETVAAQLMQQWMNSPGHRANILRPEFTHMGVGVISSKDSTVQDTLIKGRKTRRVIYFIRHHGTQVFTSRSLVVSKLELTRKETEFLIFDLEIEHDRNILASFDNYTQFFRPKGKKIRLHIEYPMLPTISVYLAHVQNEYTGEYISFFRDDIVRENLVRTLDKLSRISFPLIGKDIRIEKKTKYFLLCESTLFNADSISNALINVDEDRYYEMDLVQNQLNFAIPVESDGRIHKISVAVGKGRSKAITNQIRIDTGQLNTVKNKERNSNIFLK